MFQLSRLRDWSLLLLCNLIWASQYVTVKIVQEQMGPVFATFFPVSLATLLLVAIVWRDRLPKHDLFAFFLIGVCGQIPAQLFVTWGVGLSLASNAALLALTLPILTALMAYFILGERMTLLRWVSFALAIAGAIECAGINWNELDFTSVRFMFGSFLIFLGIVGSAFYNVYSKKLLKRYSPLQVQLYSYYAVLICLIPITLYVEPQGFINLPHFTLRTWIGLMELAIFVYFLSMVLFLNVLTRLDATQAAVSNYLIPFFGLLLAAALLHERLTTFMIVGGILVLASTLMITVWEERLRSRSGKVGPSTKECD
jgi:drug/metabolite transporter (DMT)-like permease